MIDLRNASPYVTKERYEWNVAKKVELEKIIAGYNKKLAYVIQNITEIEEYYNMTEAQKRWLLE